MKEYRVIIGYNLSNDFVEKMNKRLNEGWELVGGVCVVGSSHSNSGVYQTIVRDTGKNKENKE